MADINKDWISIQQENTVWNGTARWKENRQVQVSNTTIKPTREKNQIGGTAMVIFNNLVLNRSEQECDGHKVGCWSYISITGKHDIIATYITCNCSVRGSSTGSNYAQQLLYIYPKIE